MKGSGGISSCNPSVDGLRGISGDGRVALATAAGSGAMAGAFADGEEYRDTD